MNDAPLPLPSGVRWAAIFAMALSAWVGFFSANEAAALSNLSALENLQVQPPGEGASAELLRKLVEVQTQVYVSSLRGMKGWRSYTVGALALVCALLFVASARLLWPAGVPRSSMRRLLVFAATAGAVLRTVDGAQLAVVARRVGAALEGVMQQQAPAEAYLPGTMTTVAVVLAAGQTLVVAGGLAFLSTYFRSERIRSALTDEPKPPR